MRALADGRFNDDFCFLAGYIPEGGDLLPAFGKKRGCPKRKAMSSIHVK